MTTEYIILVAIVNGKASTMMVHKESYAEDPHGWFPPDACEIRKAGTAKIKADVPAMGIAYVTDA
jgi:hypothetical protein